MLHHCARSAVYSTVVLLCAITVLLCDYCQCQKPKGKGQGNAGYEPDGSEGSSTTNTDDRPTNITPAAGNGNGIENGAFDDGGESSPPRNTAAGNGIVNLGFASDVIGNSSTLNTDNTLTDITPEPLTERSDPPTAMYNGSKQKNKKWWSRLGDIFKPKKGKREQKTEKVQPKPKKSAKDKIRKFLKIGKENKKHSDEVISEDEQHVVTELKTDVASGGKRKKIRKLKYKDVILNRADLIHSTYFERTQSYILGDIRDVDGAEYLPEVLHSIQKFDSSLRTECKNYLQVFNMNSLGLFVGKLQLGKNLQYVFEHPREWAEMGDSRG